MVERHIPVSDIHAETIKREWSGALLKWWFLPFLVAATAGFVASKAAPALNPLKFSAITYIYAPPVEVTEFRQAVDALPDDVERLSDPYGNQHLVVEAATFSDALDRLTAARATLDAVAEARLKEPGTAAPAEIAIWVQKFRGQSVSMSQRGGSGETASIAITLGFMLTLFGILLARSRKFDATVAR